ncbi:hypothetical protein OAM82_00265 [Candidatus Thioglobus sp.]|nr:hypothetical protein [Candidatus Thioglobus sp.]
MKKQLLIAAVAATMTSAAMADLSISGDAKFEYQNVDTGTATNVNKTNTEVNLKLRGKSGDTSVVIDVASNGAVSTGNGSGLVVENQYITSKIGDVSVKAGNFTSGTSALLGEIDEGGRSNNKVHLSTTLGGMSVYMGNSGSSTGSTGFTSIDNNMYAGVSAKVAGFTVQAKKNSPTVDSFGIAGDVAGASVRLETKSDDAVNSDVTFGNITTDVNGVSLGYAWIDADQDGLIDETDSAIFAVENTSGNSNSQIMAKTSMAGNTVTVKSGTQGFDSTVDLDYTQVGVSRPLASGATIAFTYTNKDTAADAETKTFEADLSVKF